MRLEPRFQIPDDPKEAIKAISERLRVLEDLVQKTTVAQTKVVTVEPAKPRDGMFAYADGVNWDPGAGRGLYQYVNGTWEPVSAPRPDQIPQTPWAQDVDGGGHKLTNVAEVAATLLRADGLVLAAKPSCHVYRNTGFTLGSGAWQALEFDTLWRNSGTMFSLATPTRLTCTAAGLYLFIAGAGFAPSTLGNARGILFAFNGSGTSFGVAFVPAILTGTFSTRVVSACVLSLTVGQYIEVKCYQDTGGGLALNVGQHETWCIAQKVE